MIVLRVPWLPFRETRIPSSFPSSIFRPFYNIFSSPKQVRRFESQAALLTFHFPRALIGGIITRLSCFLPLKIYPPFVLHANTNTPTPPFVQRMADGSSSPPRFTYLSGMESGQAYFLRRDKQKFRPSRGLSFVVARVNNFRSVFLPSSGKSFRILRIPDKLFDKLGTV